MRCRFRPVPFSFAHTVPSSPTRWTVQVCRFATCRSLSFWRVWITSPRADAQPVAAGRGACVVDPPASHPLVADARVQLARLVVRRDRDRVPVARARAAIASCTASVLSCNTTRPSACSRSNSSAGCLARRASAR